MSLRETFDKIEAIFMEGVSANLGASFMELHFIK
jgi:hypothetical protein